MPAIKYMPATTTYFDQGLQNNFNLQSWYSGTIDPDVFDASNAGNLNGYESANVKLLMRVENAKDGYTLDQ